MQNPKILWVNPSFLDYRIPLYKELFELCNGGFYLVYSKERVPQRCIDKVEQALGPNAIGLEKEKRISLGLRGDFANTGVSIPFPKGLGKLIASVDADIIIAEGYFQFTPWALKRARARHIPLMIAYERTAHTERNCPWWRKSYRRLVDRFTSGYIANGSLTKEYLMSQGVSEDVIFTGGMCADSRQLALDCAGFRASDTSSFRAGLGLNSDGLTYLYVGRLIELKGLDYLLEAWAEHRRAYPCDKLLIVGSGPLYDRFLAEYGDDSSICFTGAVDYSAIYKYYAVSDVFVIPTLEDNWSLVVPEAMACGLPVACSVYNGCHPELVVEGRNGFVFDPFDRSSIIQSLHKFHKVDLKRYSKESVEIESDYNPQKTAARIFRAACHILRQ